MFLNKKTLLGIFTLLATTGCVNTIDLEQQQQITDLQTTLSTSDALAIEKQTELDNTLSKLKLSEERVATLTTALANSKKKHSQRVATSSQPKITHLDDKTILGQTEWVYVSALKENFKGRIDTGATTSSINAVDIIHFERDGKKWVRFNLTHAEGENAETIEAKVVRTAKIKQSNTPEEAIDRPVIQLHVRIGDVAHLTEFTLTNRSHMAYPVLIGRTFMRDVILVDVSKEYTFPKYQTPNKTKG